MILVTTYLISLSVPYMRWRPKKFFFFSCFLGLGNYQLSQPKSESNIFASLPESFEVARYHSLHGIKDKMPACLEVTATTDDGIVMGIQHKTLPFAAVQFHPESILTSPATGMTILKNALHLLRYPEENVN